MNCQNQQLFWKKSNKININLFITKIMLFLNPKKNYNLKLIILIEIFMANMVNTVKYFLSPCKKKKKEKQILRIQVPYIASYLESSSFKDPLHIKRLKNTTVLFRHHQWNFVLHRHYHFSGIFHGINLKITFQMLRATTFGA